jgi:phosphoribosylamine---glycine ligase
LPVDVPIVHKSVGVTMAANGYPDEPRKGDIITGIDIARKIAGVQVIPAGVSRDPDGTLRTAGGRVLTVVGTGETYEDARVRAYAAAALIRFEGRQFRDDIATEDDLAA